MYRFLCFYWLMKSQQPCITAIWETYLEFSSSTLDPNAFKQL